MRYLRDLWAKHLQQFDRVRINTSFNTAFSCGIANVDIEGIDPGKITSHLWKKHRIIVTPIKHAEFQGIRVSPNVFTTRGELERFVDAMELIIKNGVET
jgi:selenocysteine lyase/cysteine desulfurase